MCCFKSLKNFEKLNNMVQLILSVAIRVIQTMPEDFIREQNRETNKDKNATEVDQKNINVQNEDIKVEDVQTSEKSDDVSMDTDEDSSEEPDKWLMEEKEKLLNLVTKIFLMNFPVYMAYKHMVQTSLEV